MNTLKSSFKITNSIAKRYNFLDFPDTARRVKDISIDLADKVKTIGNSGFVRLVDCMPRVIPSNCSHLMCDHDCTSRESFI